MNYVLIESLNDPDIPHLISIHNLPEHSRYISINEKKYFKYVVKNDSVYYYKIFENNTLIGSVHCELSKKTMYLSLLVFPEYQGNGYGTKIIEQITNGILPLDFENIEVSINDDNPSSLHIFEKVGFIKTSTDGGLINYIYTKR